MGSSYLLASDLRLFPVNSITFHLQERSQQETSGYFLFYETQFDYKSPESPGGQPFLEDVGLPRHFWVLWGSPAAAAEGPHLLMPAVENTPPRGPVGEGQSLWVPGSSMPGHFDQCEQFILCCNCQETSSWPMASRPAMGLGFTLLVEGER